MCYVLELEALTLFIHSENKCRDLGPEIRGNTVPSLVGHRVGLGE